MQLGGALLVPAAAYGPGNTRGDGVKLIQPDDPAYEEWMRWIARLAARSASG